MVVTVVEGLNSSGPDFILGEICRLSPEKGQ